MRSLLTASVLVWLLSVLAAAAPQSSTVARRVQSHPEAYFKTSADCLACHNGLTTPSGEDVSIGADWRATMMANSARDPYWQASVRREIADHPTARQDIEDECSVCHMPMTRTAAHLSGATGEIFSHLPVTLGAGGDERFAHDGVSCTVCHQISDAKLGTPESFTGGYVIDASSEGPRRMFGPFAVDNGRTTIMRSSTAYRPTESAHVQRSELCATCHTLYTTALDAQGRPIGRLPEQMPYLEWQHSSYANSRSCQSCHMPIVDEDTPIASVLGEPRKLARHTFRGGNFFMLRMLNRFRTDLGVNAPAVELDRAAAQTVRHLQTETAAIVLERLDRSDRRLMIDLRVENRSGHKLPTGYPARRVWVHLTVRDAGGRPIFESGAVRSDGLIEGNDNDRDASLMEPHYTDITAGDQVQIYESVMADVAGRPTTGLLHGVRYLKDNRLLPRGFDKGTASADIAVVGGASGDADFGGGSDRIRYAVDVDAAGGPYEVEAELRFQPIAYRWARNLSQYDAAESRRFVGYYDAMARSSAETLVRVTARTAAAAR